MSHCFSFLKTSETVDSVNSFGEGVTLWVKIASMLWSGAAKKFLERKPYVNFALIFFFLPALVLRFKAYYKASIDINRRQETISVVWKICFSGCSKMNRPNLFTACACFSCPDVKRAGTGNSVLMSPEQGVFGFGSIDLLAGEEEDDIFNPYV